MYDLQRQFPQLWKLRPGLARSFKPKLLANGNGAFPPAAAALDGNTLIAFSYCQVFTFLASLLFTQPISFHISFLCEMHNCIVPRVTIGTIFVITGDVGSILRCFS
jgi:hypothetical protein